MNSYNKPMDMSLKQANGMLVTFAFTRHPFSRLVSAYYSKVALVIGESLGPVVNEEKSSMMIKYGHLSPNNTKNYPTPIMFVTYLLMEANKNGNCGSLTFNVHWRPQYALCPFCRLEFDLLLKIESMESNMRYLAELLQFPVIIE